MNMTFSFDTVTKSGKAQLDGADIPDVSRVEFYHLGGGRYEMSVYCRSADPAAGVHKQVCLTASRDDGPELTPELARAVAARYKA